MQQDHHHLAIGFPPKLIHRAAILAFIAFSPGLVRAQFAVTVAGELDRYSPTAVLPQNTAYTMYAAKGESESFQIMVTAPAGGLTNVNVVVPNLVGPGGQFIPSSSLTLFREQYIYVDQAISPAEAEWDAANLRQGPGWYPDGLIPFNDPISGASLSNSGAQYIAVPFNLAASTNQGIWVDVTVPRTATAGVYTGTFVVTSNQGQQSVTLSLTVWNFSLPVQPTLRSNLNYWAGSANLAALTSQDTKNTNIMLMENRLMPAIVNPPDESLYIGTYGLTNTGLPLWSGGNANNCAMSPAPSVATIQALLAQQQPNSIFVSLDIADEVGSCLNLYPLIQQWGANAHLAGVDSMVVMPPTTALFSDGTGSGRSAVDVWDLLPFQYDAEPSVVNQALAKGDTVWSYNALMQDQYSPKWILDYAPVNFRLQPGFINQSLGLSGISYWRIDNWTSAPWTNLDSIIESGYIYTGEGVLAYPGAQVGVVGCVPSMRLKYLRDGSDDFEYIQMLKNMGYGAWALQVAATVGPNWTNWTRSSAAVDAARIQLGMELDQLNGGSASTTPSLTITGPANGATVSGTVSVTTTTSNVVRAELSIDDAYNSTVLTPPFNFSWNSATVANGSHVITVVGYSSTWQMSIQSVTVTVGAATPATPVSLSISQPTAGATVSGTITVTPVVSANVVRVEYSIDEVYNSTFLKAPFTFSWNTGSVPAGNHTITAVAYDAVWDDAIVSVPVTTQ